MHMQYLSYMYSPARALNDPHTRPPQYGSQAITNTHLRFNVAKGDIHYALL